MDNKLVVQNKLEPLHKPIFLLGVVGRLLTVPDVIEPASFRWNSKVIEFVVVSFKFVFPKIEFLYEALAFKILGAIESLEPRESRAPSTLLKINVFLHHIEGQIEIFEILIGFPGVTLAVVSTALPKIDLKFALSVLIYEIRVLAVKVYQLYGVCLIKANGGCTLYILVINLYILRKI